MECCCVYFWLLRLILMNVNHLIKNNFFKSLSSLLKFRMIQNCFILVQSKNPLTKFKRFVSVPFFIRKFSNDSYLFPFPLKNSKTIRFCSISQSKIFKKFVSVPFSIEKAHKNLVYRDSDKEKATCTHILLY